MSLARNSDRGAARLFEAAAGAAGIVERWIMVAGMPIRLRFTGEAMLTRIGGAFDHLITGPRQQGALTIDIWDTSSTGVGEPPFFGAPVEADGIDPSYYYDESGVRALSQRQTLSVLDFGAQRGWFWTRDPFQMRSWDWAAPLRTILHWWLGQKGILQVHGGAIGHPDGGVLVVGRGGSGKSTTTLSCLLSGLRYAGDDYVALELGPEPWVHSLYSTGKLEPHHLQRFPSLLPSVVNPVRTADDKAVLYATDVVPAGPIAGFPLRAVLVPRVVASEPATRLGAISRAAALAALAPSTMFQLHPPQRDGLAKMATLLSRVPCYSLELGSDIARIPEAVRSFLESDL